MKKARTARWMVAAAVLVALTVGARAPRDAAPGGFRAARVHLIAETERV